MASQYTPSYPNDRGSEIILPLIAELNNRDGMKRQRARYALIHNGKRAVPFLIGALHDRRNQVRWGAAKALAEIRAPEAAKDLVGALRDSDIGVRWLAGEALIAMPGAAVEPLLEGLKEHFASVWMREGALHVLHGLQKKQLLTPALFQVVLALSGPAPEAEVPWAAYMASKNLKENLL